MASTTKINSFVFFDIETTGLKSYDKITEMCLIAVHRSAIEDDQVSTPRVMDKLVLCVDPERELSSTAESISGLDQDIFKVVPKVLKEVETFEKSTLRN